MKKSYSFPLIIAILVITFFDFQVIIAQNKNNNSSSMLQSKRFSMTDMESARKIAKIKGNKWRQRKAEADSLASLYKLPIMQEYPDGTIRELVRFERGLPIYYKTYNLNAAQTISTDKVWFGSGGNYSLTGTGILLGIWDGRAVRSTHNEFTGRVTQKDTATITTEHATHVAGTMIAYGNQSSARGMAGDALLHAYDWLKDIEELAIADISMQVTNHSYGRAVGWEFNPTLLRWEWFGDVTISQEEDFYFGYYDNVSQDIDEIVSESRPQLLPVVAAGNDRGEIMPNADDDIHYVFDPILGIWVEEILERPSDGGTDGYDCIPGGLATAKNVLTVGAINDIPGGYEDPMDAILTSFSSWGPTDDGRIKPDVIANGDLLYSCSDLTDNSYAGLSGTSMAAPNVSGSIALILEYYNTLFSNRQAMHASTIKALIINTVDKTGQDIGPCYSFGWGLMNTQSAIELLDKEAFDGEGSHIGIYTLTGESVEEITIQPTGIEPLSVTICWSDPPGTPPEESLNPTTKMLVNDLDLKLKDAQEFPYYPYVLDRINPQNQATTGDNDVDNVEKIILLSPNPELYTAEISHEGFLYGGQQIFSIVVSGGYITEPGINDPPPPGQYAVTWDQVLSNDSHIGEVTFWNSWGEANASRSAPDVVYKDIGSGTHPSDVSATKQVLFGEKFNNWDNSSPNLIERFTYSSSRYFTAHLKLVVNVEIINNNSSLGGDGKIYFEDPWLIIEGDPLYGNPYDIYGTEQTPYVNLGVNAPFIEYQSPLDLSINSVNKGVILDQYSDDLAYYSVGVQHFFVSQNAIYEFYQWTASPSGSAVFEDPYASETVVTFKQDGAIVEAQYRSVNTISNYKMIVQEGEALLIPEGTNITCAPGFRIESHGRLEIIGSQENQVVFIRQTQQSPTADDRLFILRDPDTESDNWNQPWVNIEFCRFENFRNGSSSDNDPVISFTSSGPKEIFPGGSWMEKGSTFYMKNCVFNNCDWAISIDGWGGPECIYNCTFYKSPILNFDNYAYFLNCIFYEGELNLNNSMINRCVFYNVPDVNDWMALGEYNQNADPIFVDPTNNNFHIRRNSPCVDFGKPYFYLYNMTEYSYDPDGTSLDIGAFYYPNLQDPVLSGDVEYDMCVSGSVQITSNLTVLSKVHLTILPGTTVRLNNDALLWIRGKLDAQGTSAERILFTSIFDNPPSNMYWNRIYIADDNDESKLKYCNIEFADNGIHTLSNTSIEYCNISDIAYTGVRIERAKLIVNNCNISDCKYGIYIYKNNYESGKAKILNNSIHGNLYYGIYLYKSSPEIRDNDIYNNNVCGIRCQTNSSPRLGQVSYWGNNYIHNNPSGLKAYYSSNPFLGLLGCTINGGNNRIENNSVYHIFAYSNCNIVAQNNYWNPASSSKFYATGGSSIDWSHALSIPPLFKLAEYPEDVLFEEMLASINPIEEDIHNSRVEKNIDWRQYFNSEWSLKKKIVFARLIGILGEIEFAQEICTDIIDMHADSSLAFYALDVLWELSRYDNKELQFGLEKFESDLSNWIKKNSNKKIHKYMEMINAGFSKMNQVNKLDRLMENVSDSEIHCIALFDKFLTLYIEQEDNDAARDVLKQLNELYPRWELTLDANRLFGIDIPEPESFKQSSMEGQDFTPIEYKLLGNFPNPFNPTTTLQYAIPEASLIEFEIYDMLGRKIWQYNESLSSQGVYQLTWDGKDQAGNPVSSGIYIIRFTAESTSQNENSYTESLKVTLLR